MADIPIVRQPNNFYGKLGDIASFSVVTGDVGAGVVFQWQYSSDEGVTWTNSPATGNKTATLVILINEARLGLLYRCSLTFTGYDTTYTDIVRLILEEDALKIVLQTNQSENICLDKTVVDVSTMFGYLRAPSSIIDPIIIIEAELHDVVDVNYVTIPQFKRSYFVKNVTSVREGLIEFTLHVDVLSTYASQIRANKGIVKKAEGMNAYNLMINDDSLVAYQNPHILTEPFPSGFTGYTFVFAVASGGTP